MELRDIQRNDSPCGAETGFETQIDFGFEIYVEGCIESRDLSICGTFDGTMEEFEGSMHRNVKFREFGTDITRPF